MGKVYRKIKRITKKICLRAILKIQCAADNVIHCGNDYGGFDVAADILDEINLKRKVIVYSFGIGEDLSFSQEVYERWDCEIFAFDPTPKAIEYVENSSMSDKIGFHFYPWGLSDKDGAAQFFLPKERLYVPAYMTNGEKVEEISGSLVEYEGVGESISVEFRTLQTIMEQMGHSQIDLLKMDIEGSEFAVIDEILNSGVVFEELCLEIHNRFFKNGRGMLKDMVNKLNGSGYYIASVSHSMYEITFVRNKGISF